MKVTWSKPAKAFEPVEVTIAIESEDELLCLYHRHNVSWSKVCGYEPYSGRRVPTKMNRDDVLFDALAQIVREAGL
jgi:hypothetical protein